MKRHHSLLAFSSCLLVGAIAGFMMGQQNTTQNQPAQTASNIPVAGEELLANKTATFEGEIVRFDGSNLQVKDQNGQTQAFPVDQKVLINKINANGAQGSPSADLKQIETGRPAYIFLKYMDGQYKVNYISFLPK